MADKKRFKPESVKSDKDKESNKGPYQILSDQYDYDPDQKDTPDKSKEDEKDTSSRGWQDVASDVASEAFISSPLPPGAKFAYAASRGLGRLVAATDSAAKEGEVEETALKDAEKMIAQIEGMFKKNPEAGNMVLQKMDKKYRPLIAGLMRKPEYDISKLKEKNAYVEQMGKLHQNIKKNFLDQYQTSQGNFSPEAAMAEAESRVQKPQVTGTALEQAKERGPLQMETPQIKDKDAQVIAQAITSSFAGAVESIAAPAAGVEYGQAVTTPTSSEVLLKSANMINSDIQQFEEKKQKVELINLRLMHNYRNNIDRMQQEYDKRLDTAERMYQKTKLAEFENIVSRYDRYTTLATKLKEAELTGKIQNLTQEEANKRWTASQEIQRKKFNTSQRNKLKIANQRRAMKLWEIKIRQRQLARKRQMKNMPDMSERIAAFNRMTGVSFNLTHDATNKAMQVMMQNPQLSGFNNVANEYVNNFVGILREYEPEEVQTAITNMIKVADKGFLFNSINEETLNDLSKKEFSIGGAGDVVAPNIDSKNVSESSLSSLVVFKLVSELGQASMNAAEQIDLEDQEEAVTKEATINRVMNIKDTGGGFFQ